LHKCAALSGLGFLLKRLPGALPRAVLSRAFSPNRFPNFTLNFVMNFYEIFPAQETRFYSGHIAVIFHFASGSRPHGIKGFAMRACSRKELPMLNLKKMFLVGGMCATFALTGCEMMNHHGDRTMGRRLDDATITSTVKHDLNREPVYKFGDVDVKTFDGVVQLSGFVNTDEQKNRAGEIARQSEGVTQVQNNISLKPQNNLEPTGRYDNNYRHDNDNDRHDNNNNYQPAR
jgi:hyperosmotically inducible periplasmic protein